MADQATAHSAPMLEVESAARASAAGVERAWSGLWQMPVILVSIAMLAGAFLYARRSPSTEDVLPTLTRAESLIRSGDTEAAAMLLEVSVAPWIEATSGAERGRFHALVADAILGSLNRLNSRNPSLLEAGARHAAAAVELGYLLMPDQIERWGAAEFALDRPESAKQRLATLDRLAADPALADEARPARNRLLRRMIAMLVADGRANPQEALDLLNFYRADTDLATADRVWAAAREAEMHLEVGATRDAIDRLMLDIRLLDRHLRPGSDLGELLALLARGYLELGDIGSAEAHCDHAIEVIAENDPRRGAVLVVQGWILAAQSRFEEALAAFTTSISEFPGAASHAAALLGQAEMHGVLGHDPASQSAYRALAERFRSGRVKGRLTAEGAVTMLAERRHDGALARGDVNLASEYIGLARLFLDLDQLPDGVLARIGATNRALGEHLLSEAADGPRAWEPASRHFRAAAEAYRALAVTREGAADREEAWLEALWSAADNFDMAGDYDSAIAHYQECLSWRTMNDSRGLAAASGAARCHLAAGRANDAAALYEQIIAENPNHPIAAASHLPLSRCYEMLNLPGKAEQELLHVVSGRAPLEPAALDYREALVALAEHYFKEAKYRQAIEQFSVALGRYPEDARSAGWPLRLAECYLGNARQIEEAIESGAIAGAEVQEARALRRRHLREAMANFAQMAERLDRIPKHEIKPFELEELLQAWTSLGECAFALEEYRSAIEHYERVAAKFNGHPTSLIAIIQVVNCHNALGDRVSARSAHERALLRLAELPESAFEGPSGVFDEPAWRRWLEGLPPGSGSASPAQRASADAIPIEQ